MGPPIRFGQALRWFEPPLGPALRLYATAGTFPYVQDLRRVTDLSTNRRSHPALWSSLLACFLLDTALLGCAGWLLRFEGGSGLELVRSGFN